MLTAPLDGVNKSLGGFSRTVTVDSPMPHSSQTWAFCAATFFIRPEGLCNTPSCARSEKETVCLKGQGKRGQTLPLSGL